MFDEISHARRAFVKKMIGGAAWATGYGLLSPFPALSCPQELPLDVGPQARVAAHVKLGKELYHPGEVVRGEVTLNSPRTDLPVEVVWTDGYGRVAGRVKALPAHSFNNVAEFAIPLESPLTYVNSVEVLVEGVTQIERARFLLSPKPDAWDDYHVINYAFYPHGYYEKLREAGVDAVIAYRDKPFDAFLDNNFRFYVEETIWEILATYHKNFTLWKELVRRFMENRNDWKLLVRDPCFNDPKTFEYAREVLSRQVDKYKKFQPLFYDLADEIGIGDQIAPLDLCHSNFCIRGFAQYLKGIYDSMHEVRHEWDVDFYHWDDEQVDQGAKFNWDDLMIHETTTDRAMDRLLMNHLRRTYKTVTNFNKAWGVSFPAAPGPSEYVVMDWTPVLAPLADTRSLTTLDEKSLNEVFGSPEAANIAWGLKGGWTTDRKPTKFKTWGEAIAYVQRLEKTLGEITSTEGWNLAAWCDFRNFMDLTMADFIRRARDVCRALDPHARAGTEGGQSPWAFGWYNYENVCDVVDVIEPYNIGNNVEIIRGLGNHRLIQLNTYGFQHKPGSTIADLTEEDRQVQRRATRKVWWQLFHESRAAIIWDYTERDYRFVSPERELTPAALTFKDTFREVRAGIGKLVINARRRHDGIAIHYSHPSVQVHWMIENLKVGKRWPVDEVGDSNLRFNGVRNSITKLIEDLNLQYEFVGSRQLVGGALESGGFKVFILPQSIAMSADEVARVREFAENGGTVIADYRLARMNEHGRDLGQGQLDALFGIARGVTQPAAAGPVRGIADFRGVQLKGKSWNLKTGETNLELHGGTALAQQGNVPAVIVREVGKGLAAYLNLELFPYQHWRVRPGPEAPVRELMGALLAQAGIQPRVRVLDSQGAPVPAVEAVVYDFGGQQLVAVFRNPQVDPGGWADGPRVAERGWSEEVDNSALETPVEATVHLPDGFHVYDVRGARALGQVSTLRATIDPWTPLVFMLSPTPISGLKLRAPSNLPHGRKAEIEAQIEDQPVVVQPRIVRLEVFDPAGKLVEHYSGNIRFEGALGKLEIPFAWNDSPGVWRVCAREIASGASAETTLRVSS